MKITKTIFRQRLRTSSLQKLKMLLALPFACLTMATAHAQSPQWVMAQAPAPANTGQVVLNYFVPAGQQGGDPYHINRLSQAYSKPGTPNIFYNFSRIYGSAVYRSPNYPPSIIDYSQEEVPLFIIAKETSAASSANIKIYRTSNQFGSSGSTSVYSHINTTATVTTPNASLFDGQNGLPTIHPDDEPEFTIIPRMGHEGDYLAFTYIRTAANNGANGMLLFFVIKSNGTFMGPYYPKYSGVEITAAMNTWGPKGAIAIEHPKFSNAWGLRQSLYVAIENKGIYRFSIDHYSLTDVLTSSSLGNGPTFYPTLICGTGISQPGSGPYTQVPGSNFKTSELELSPDGNTLAWADDNSYSPGTGLATVYTISPNVSYSSRVVKTIPITSPTVQLSQQKVSGLEFNPFYNPTAASPINTQLYVTAGAKNGSSFHDGLLQVNVPSSGTPTVTPIPYLYGASSSPCAQSQLEIDYNKALAMVYEENYSAAEFRTYLPHQSTSQTGEWKYVEVFTAESFPPGYDIHRLPRQVDNWDYKFGGKILGQNQPVVANGGCTPVTVQTYITYSAPIITSVATNQLVYSWRLTDLATGVFVTGNNSTFAYDFINKPAFNDFELTLVMDVIDYYNPSQFSTPDYTYRYKSRMAISTRNGCSPPSNGSRIAQNNATGVTKMILYPNPVTEGKLNIQLPSGYQEAKITVSDLQGRLVRKGNINETFSFDLQNLSAGVYIVNVITSDFSKKEKIVIPK